MYCNSSPCHASVWHTAECSPIKALILANELIFFEASYHQDFVHQHIIILYVTPQKQWPDCCHTAYQCGCDNDAWDRHNEWKPYHTDRTCVVSLQCAWKHAVTAQLVSWRLYHSLQLHTYGASLLDALGDEPCRDQRWRQEIMLGTFR